MIIIHIGRGSCKTPLLSEQYVNNLVENSEKHRYSFDTKGPENLREFEEFLSQIDAKRGKHDDMILSLYPVDPRKSDNFKP